MSRSTVAGPHSGVSVVTALLTFFCVLLSVCATPAPLTPVLKEVAPQNVTFVAALLALHNEGQVTTGVPNVTVALLDFASMLNVYGYVLGGLLGVAAARGSLPAFLWQTVPVSFS